MTNSTPTKPEIMAELHRTHAPRRYVEIGVAKGDSLVLADCRAVGIDPKPKVRHKLGPSAKVFRSTSDRFFRKYDLIRELGGPFDLAFIDGMHLFEFALRDFMNLERYADRGRAIVMFDDVLPRAPRWALRNKRRRGDPPEWTGDVWNVIPCPARYRPDLTLVPISCEPAGLLVVANLDPGNSVLFDRYDEIVSGFVADDEGRLPDQSVLDQFVHPSTSELAHLVPIGPAGESV